MRKPETRPVAASLPSFESAKRVAELGVERYGWAKVRGKGSKDQPFYTDLVAVPLQASVALEERLKIEEKMQQQVTGGHVTVLPLEDVEQNPDALWAITKRIVTTSRIGLFTYNRSFAYCSRCRKTFFGQKSKCPVCASLVPVVISNPVPPNSPPRYKLKSH